MCFKQTGVPSAGLSHTVWQCVCWKWAKIETSGILRSKGTEQNLHCPQDNPPGAAPQEPRRSNKSHCQSSLFGAELQKTKEICEVRGMRDGWVYPDFLHIQFSFWSLMVLQALLIPPDICLTQTQASRACQLLPESPSWEIQTISGAGRKWDLLKSFVPLSETNLFSKYQKPVPLICLQGFVISSHFNELKGQGEVGKQKMSPNRQCRWDDSHNTLPKSKQPPECHLKHICTQIHLNSWYCCLCSHNFQKRASNSLKHNCTTWSTRNH